MIKKLIRRGIQDLVPYPPGKPIEELERELGIHGSIKLASNENPLGPSPLAVQAVMEKAKTLHRYPDGSGYYLKAKLSEKFGLPSEQIILGNGSNELIELLVRTFLAPGEEAVQAFPTFLVYEKIVKGAGGKMISVPLSGFALDLDEIARAITPSTKILFLNNPNNPTGSALGKEELGNFLARLPRSVIIALDEAYIEFAPDPEVANGVEFLGRYPNLFVLRTFSKLYGLAGLRIGYGFGCEELIDFMNRVRQPFNANTLAQAAAEAALDDDDFISRTLTLVREGLDYLGRRLDEMRLEHVPTHTNFFLIKVPGGGRKIYQELLHRGVIVRSMESYGLGDYIRVNVGLPKENERFLNSLDEILRRL